MPTWISHRRHHHLDVFTPGTKQRLWGPTTVIDFISQDHPSLLANVDAWRRKVEENAAVDYGFHMNITHLEPRVLADIPLLVKEGITSLKVFTAYNGRLRLQDGDIFRVLRTAAEHGMLTMVHAENGDVIDLLVNEAVAAGRTAPVEHALTRPAWGAVEAVLRAEALAAMADAPLYLVHMNAGGRGGSAGVCARAGFEVMAESCPQYLFLTEDDLRRPDGAKWICRHPCGKQRSGTASGMGFNMSASRSFYDHCPFFYNGSQPIVYEGKRIAIPGKELGLNDFTKIPKGLPGIGDRLPVMWTKGVGTGKISPNQFVALTSTNPAKIFGLYPQKGALLPGSDADLAIWDPELRVDYGVRVARHRTDYNLFEGWVERLSGEGLLARKADGRWQRLAWKSRAGTLFGAQTICQHSLTMIVFFIAFSILTLSAGCILALSPRVIRLGVAWLWSAGAAFVSWIMMIFLRQALPDRLTLKVWTPAGTPQMLTAFHLDAEAWIFLTTFLAVLLAGVLTDAARISPATRPAVWAGALAMGALSFGALTADKTAAFIFSRVVLDGYELVVFRQKRKTRAPNQQYALNLVFERCFAVISSGC